jgi:Tfp pilus assembly protein FimT
MRPGTTLVELVVFCTLIGLLAGITFPRARHVIDGLRLRQAAHEVSGALVLTRAAAIRRGERARVIVDPTAASLRVESGTDTLLRRDLHALHRVTLRASRDTITYAPTGLGWGLANSTIVVSIGVRAETVTVARLGRVRASY